MPIFEYGDIFPSTAHQERIGRYKRNRQLFKGEHFEVLTRLNAGDYKDLLYISMNIVGLICKKSADFLFSESARILAPDSAGQTILDDITNTNHMDILSYESALANAYKGDIFFKLMYGQEFEGVVPSAYDPFKVRIALQNPEYVYPETNAMNAKQIIKFHIVIPEQIDKVNYLLHIETHEPMQIRYNTCKAVPMSYYPDMSVKSWKIGAFTTEEEIVYTGVGRPLVIHVPNYSVDDSFEGIDDISEFIPLIDEINNRLTQIASILDKHADPALAVPTGTLGEDENGNPVFNVSYNKVFETDSKEDFIPQYIVWNGQLESAFKELTTLIDNLYTMAEIPPVALGKDESGTSGSSGLAIKYRLNSMLAKTNRKRRYYQKGLTELYILAQQLEASMTGAAKTLVLPQIIFRDGLPNDYVSDANVMQVRTNSAQTMSVKTALMTYQGFTEEQADSEVKKILEERKLNKELFEDTDKPEGTDNRMKEDNSSEISVTEE
jgi:Phage portal protein, SPP1 Gp6-like.